MVSWSVDVEAGHCTQRNLLHVFVSIEKGVTKCIGPIQNSPLLMEPQDVLHSMAELELALFSQAFQPVVWGGYEPTPQFREHLLNINGSYIGWLPNLALRTPVGQPDANMPKEWTVIDGYRLRHYSGITFTYGPFDCERGSDAVSSNSAIADGCGQPLGQVLHPDTIDATILALKEQAAHYLGTKTSNLEVERNKIDGIRWEKLDDYAA